MEEAFFLISVVFFPSAKHSTALSYCIVVAPAAVDKPVVVAVEIPGTI